MKYIKQLDSMRAIAVFFVIIGHWLYKVNLVTKFPFGEIGVDIFFVLSGFLIITILLQNKMKSEQLRISKTSVLKNFYIRRILRISPIYYLLITILFVFHDRTGTSLQVFPYLLTYTSNFYFYKIQGWDYMVAHLWSLAVEEQYYLIWPFIILFFKKEYLAHAIIFFISTGIMCQYFFASNMSFIITPSCFDAFGLGSLLSWQTLFNSTKLPNFFSSITILAFVCLIFFLIGLGQYQWNFVPIRTLVSIMALWVITYVLLKYKKAGLKILDNKFLIFTGKISYGMYLYHLIIPGLVNSKFVNIYLNPQLPDYLFKEHWGQLYLVENIILLFLISFLSYRFVEKPFLSLKKYFEFDPVTQLSPKTQSDRPVHKF